MIIGSLFASLFVFLVITIIITKRKLKTKIRHIGSLTELIRMAQLPLQIKSEPIDTAQCSGTSDIKLRTTPPSPPPPPPPPPAKALVRVIQEN